MSCKQGNNSVINNIKNSLKSISQGFFSFQSLQAKILRVIQEREFERLGATRTSRVNVRILAATNKDLKKSIEEGTFREDLYYRLNVIGIHLSPLWEHPEDIPTFGE